MVDIKQFLEGQKGEIDAKIEEFIPKKLTKASLEKICGKPRYAYDVETASKAVNEPVWDLLSRGGKRWRPSLFLLANEAFGGDSKAIFDFVVIPEVVHNGTLMVDDCEDDSELRRGKPCIHKIYGVDVAVNAGNAMYFLPLLSLMKAKGKFSDSILLKAYEIYSQEMINLSYGQGMDIWWHKGNKHDVGEQEYLQMCAYKTGTLARMSAKLGALFANASEKEVDAIGKFAESIGVAFQIQDDILGIFGDEKQTGKSSGSDFKQNKQNILIFWAQKHANYKQKKIISRALGNEHITKSQLEEMRKIIKETKSLEYANTLAQTLVGQAKAAIEKSDLVQPAKSFLNDIANYIVSRNN